MLSELRIWLGPWSGAVIECKDHTQAGSAAARISSNSRHTVVADAGHEIHLFKPEAVIQAIQDVLEAQRHKSKLPAR